MKIGSKDYFVCANTACGFVNYFDSNLEHLQQLFVLKGASGCGKSTMMRQLGRLCQKWGYRTEYIHCSSDPQSLDGVIMPELQTAIVDGTAPHVLEPFLAGVTGEYVNLGMAIQPEKLKACRYEMITLKKEIKAFYQKAYDSLAEAKTIHDQWEIFYSSALNGEKAQQLAQRLSEEIFNGVTLTKAARVKHRFFGVLAAEGRVDYLADLIEPLKQHIILTGRPGCGKSSLMKKIAAEAQQRGYHTEIYHCSLDPESVDMVLIEELSLAVVDGTAPHEIIPANGDKVLDLYQLLIDIDVDQIHQAEIDTLSDNYTHAVQKAQQSLLDARNAHHLLEQYYQPAVDFEVIEQYTATLTHYLQEAAEKECSSI